MLHLLALEQWSCRRIGKTNGAEASCLSSKAMTKCGTKVRSDQALTVVWVCEIMFLGRRFLLNLNWSQATCTSTQYQVHAWQRIGANFFHLSRNTYLLHGIIFFHCCQTIYTYFISQSVITALKVMFSRHGIPDNLHYDNGPPFSSDEFEQFWSILQLSSFYQQSTLPTGKWAGGQDCQELAEEGWRSLSCTTDLSDNSTTLIGADWVL